jgi:HEAT repeat protein
MPSCKKHFALSLFLAALACARCAYADDPYAQLQTYDYGQSRAAVSAVEREVEAATPDQYAALETKLLAVLQSPTAKPAAKGIACRMLRYVGSTKCIPVLAALLGDEQLSVPARIGLQALPYPQVDDALRTALDTLHGNLQVGVITTLGQRRDAKAVSQLAKLLADQDPAIATAALISLGQIGDQNAATVLTTAKLPAALETQRLESCLTCADTLAAAGQSRAAAEIYSPLVTKDHPSAIRIAALAGLVHTDKALAVPALLEALGDSDVPFSTAAVHLSSAVGSPEVAKVFTARLLAAAPEAQVLMLNALADDGNRNAVDAINTLLTSNDENVRLAAIKALGKIGDASDVDTLLKLAAGKDAAATAATKSLSTLSAPGVDDALVQRLANADAAAKPTILRILAARHATAAFPAFLTAAEAPDPAIRLQAIKGLGILVDETTLPKLVALLAKDGNADVEAALAAACKRLADPAKCEGPVLAALPGAAPTAQAALLRVAAQLRSPNALAAVRDAVQSTNADVQDAAIRILAAWPDPIVAPDLLNVAKSAAKPVHRALALRGYLQLAQADNVSAETRWSLIQTAQPLLNTSESKTMLLSTLGAIHNRTALRMALGFVDDPQIAHDAVATALQILDTIGNRALTNHTLTKLLPAVKDAQISAQVQDALKKAGGSGAVPPTQDNALTRSAANIAWQGDPSSPDGWHPDGDSGGDEAAIDGDLNTYLDKDDFKPLYRFVVTFPEPHTISGISIYGYSHQNYAPKDIDIIIDGKVVKSIKGAAYTNNYFWTQFPTVHGKTIELKITAAYGASPGIRELEIYEPQTPTAQ